MLEHVNSAQHLRLILIVIS